MLAHLADVSVRSLALLIPAALILLLTRRTRSAALQHAVWTAVVCGMLALFAFGQTLPRIPLRIVDTSVVQTTATTPPATPLILDGIGALPSPATKQQRSFEWRTALLLIWASLASFFFVRFATGMILARRLFSNARLTCTPGVWESARVSVPVTVGWLRPRILLPLEWHTWPSEKLQAVLAHEGAHVRRRDGLISALAGINRSIFWFHPLAWILERKLALLADQDCDEASVALLGDRDSYARLLLEMARIVDRSQGRLQRHALTMAAGSHIGKRIEAILDESRTFSQSLTRKTKTSLMLSAVSLVLIAGAVQPVRIAQAQTTPTAGSAPTAPTPKFEVASIKPCKSGEVPPGSRGGGGRSSPGTLNIDCATVRELVGQAYVVFANGRITFNPGIRVEGGPAWIQSNLYKISARAESAPNEGIMRGPMLQSLLEDRFHVKVHRETKEVPVYALTVAKGGPKLKPFREGSCTPLDFSNAPLGPPQKNGNYCSSLGSVNGSLFVQNTHGTTLAEFTSVFITGRLDRPVIDKTGLSGRFDLQLEFLPDETTPGFKASGAAPDDPATGPSIFTAIQEQLGLKLKPARGPGEFLVIDHVDKPSEN